MSRFLRVVSIFCAWAGIGVKLQMSVITDLTLALDVSFRPTLSFTRTRASPI